MSARPPTAPEADVALVLEGTYPYVRGGVADWVHQLVTALSDLRFHLIFVGATSAMYGGLRYTLPSNVVGLEAHFIMDPQPLGPRRRAGGEAGAEAIEKLHDGVRGGDLDAAWAATLRLFDPDRGMTVRRFLRDPAVWNLLVAWYRASCPHAPFVTYYWSIRSTHLPLFALARIAAGGPHAARYHALATGFGGFLASLCARMWNRPCLLTEHGIYTKERRIELLQTPFAGESEADDPEAEERVAPVRALWTGFFEGLGRMTYHVADPIITLYEGNRARQIREGAPAARTRIVPNGIAVERYRPLRRAEPGSPPPVVALIGRVVPIKDVKSFIRAARDVRDARPDVEAWVVGNTEEDPLYSQECLDLVRALGLEGTVRLLGHRPLTEILPQVGLLALTSVSEGQPLVVLEGFAAGVPAVASDVGSCRELIEGAGEEDRAIGRAGSAVPFADPGATARAVVDLLGDPEAWRAARAAAIERVERYYRRERVYRAYRELYADSATATAAG